jgi:hypothetical protein
MEEKVEAEYEESIKTTSYNSMRSPMKTFASEKLGLIDFSSHQSVTSDMSPTRLNVNIQNYVAKQELLRSR